jgi:hypothetical protein
VESPSLSLPTEKTIAFQEIFSRRVSHSQALMNKKKTRTVILGGGCGGLYSPRGFERLRDPDVEGDSRSAGNSFLFTPMPGEITITALDVTDVAKLVSQDASSRGGLRPSGNDGPQAPRHHFYCE